MISYRGCMWLRAVSISAKGSCLVFLCGLRVPKNRHTKVTERVRPACAGAVPHSAEGVMQKGQLQACTRPNLIAAKGSCRESG